MRILLMCANGLSTGILMNKMKDWSKKNGTDLEVKAVPVDDCAGIYKEYDCLLIGPQMAYKLKEVQRIAPDRPVDTINPQDYALGRVDNIMKRVNELVNGGRQI